MKAEKQKWLSKAQSGDIRAFQKLFEDFQGPLKSYLYRLVADRNDVDDLFQDTFVKAFDKVGSFQGKSSLKTWTFTIATHLAMDHLRHQKRWPSHAQDLARSDSLASPERTSQYLKINQSSPHGTFEIQEHIDHCFTCISKSLTLEHQVAFILKDIYQFKIREISEIMTLSEGVLKHLVRDSRKKMVKIFDNRCVLVNKDGICHQCSELNGLFNPRQHTAHQLQQIEMLHNKEEQSQKTLFRLRTQLIRSIHPMQGKGADLHVAMMQNLRKSIGELS